MFKFRNPQDPKLPVSVYDSMYFDSYIKRGEVSSLEYLASKGHDKNKLIEARKAYESYEQRADPDKIKQIQALLKSEKRLGHNVKFDIDSISPPKPVIEHAGGMIPNLAQPRPTFLRQTKSGKDYVWNKDLSEAGASLPSRKVLQVGEKRKDEFHFGTCSTKQNQREKIEL